MGKLSMYKPNRGKNFKFIDDKIRQLFRIQSAEFAIHKYLGPIDQGITGDPTQPGNPTQSVTSIQDILFLENRDRKYDTSVYIMRGHYTRSDNDFDLTQFGIFLQTGTVVMNFLESDMIDILGRRLMSGDVIEFLHLKDNHVLDSTTALKRFYVCGDCSWATEGFDITWMPHLWRAKMNPLVDSQEYKDLLSNIKVSNTLGPMGTSLPAGGSSLADIMSNYNKYININEAVVAEAELNVPKSGYDVTSIYTPPVDANGAVALSQTSADAVQNTADRPLTADSGSYSPTPEFNPTGYLTGDGIPPDGYTVAAGVEFPGNSSKGDYYLRMDYLPNRLFRYDGKRWLKMEDSVRTNLTNGDPNNQTWRNSFINNTDTLRLSNGDTVPVLQPLNQILRPKANY
jgi:hypothetical protein